MPFIPANNGVKVCMRFDNAGQLACNIFYLLVEDVIDAALLESIGATFKNWFNVTQKLNVSNSTSLQAIEVTDASVAGGVGIEYTTGLPISGTNTNGNLPQNSTVSIKLSTGRTGRSYRGRSYMVGLPRDNVTATGFLTTGAQAAIDASYETLIDSLQALTWPLVVASFHALGVPRAAAVLTPVLSAAVNLALDSQRRRLPERGA